MVLWHGKMKPERHFSFNINRSEEQNMQKEHGIAKNLNTENKNAITIETASIQKMNWHVSITVHEI